MAGDLSGGDLSRLRQLDALAVVGVLRGEPAVGASAPWSSRSTSNRS